MMLRPDVDPQVEVDWKLAGGPRLSVAGIPHIAQKLSGMDCVPRPPLPVSYTHLDVYKRQGELFPVRTAGIIKLSGGGPDLPGGHQGRRQVRHGEHR